MKCDFKIKETATIYEKYTKRMSEVRFLNDLKEGELTVVLCTFQGVNAWKFVSGVLQSLSEIHLHFF